MKKFKSATKNSIIQQTTKHNVVADRRIMPKGSMKQPRELAFREKDSHNFFSPVPLPKYQSFKKKTSGRVQFALTLKETTLIPEESN